MSSRALDTISKLGARYFLYPGRRNGRQNVQYNTEALYTMKWYLETQYRYFNNNTFEKYLTKYMEQNYSTSDFPLQTLWLARETRQLSPAVQCSLKILGPKVELVPSRHVQETGSEEGFDQSTFSTRLLPSGSSLAEKVLVEEKYSEKLKS